MTAPRVRFHVPYRTGRELERVAQVVSSASHAGNGPFTRRCQELLAQRFRAPHVLLTTSCTAALELAAMALELGPGDEVIVPSFTFVSTASAFHRTGARIVFAEVDPATMTLDPADAAARVTPRTRALVPIHYAGIACAIDALDSLARRQGLALVEDAAQGLDAASGGRWLGTIGRFGAFSFHETKNIHCGLGGALFVNDPGDFDRVEDMWERGTDRSKMFRGLVDKYSWVEPGSSFFPSELQAAFLSAQLEALDENRALRMPLLQRYTDRLEAGVAAGWFHWPRVDPGLRQNAHCAYIRTHDPGQCERLRLRLVAEGIQAQIHYVPLHSSRMGQRLGYRAEDLPITERTAQSILRLPLHHELTLDVVDYVCDRLLAAFAEGAVL